MSEYRVYLDIFAGPLDLLLYLVRKEEVDIYDIPITRVTEQYIKYIEMMEELDVDLAGDFLVMAAALMEIKSRMLLPKAEEDPEQPGDPEDPRSELVRRLLEYKRFKDAANQLQDAAGQRLMRHTRPDRLLNEMKHSEEPELDLDQVSIWTLLEAFDRILRATGHASGYDHIQDDTPIDLYQIEILHRLQQEGPMPLEKIFEQRQNRIMLIGLFLALLELIRDRLVWAEQTEQNASILLKSLTEIPAEQAVRNALYRNENEAKPVPPVSNPSTAVQGEEQIQNEIIPIRNENDPTESGPKTNLRQPRIPIRETAPLDEAKRNAALSGTEKFRIEEL